MGDDLHRHCVDLHHLEVVDLVGEIEVDDPVVVLGERLLESRLLGERALGVEDHQLGFRLLRLEIVRNHARTLIRSRRTTIRVGRHRHDHNAAVVHRLELAVDLKSVV